MLDAVLLELLLAPFHLLFLTISIFTLPLFAFLVLLMLLYLTIAQSTICTSVFKIRVYNEVMNSGPHCKP